MYLLDTDTCIRILRGEDSVISRFENESCGSVFVSVITQYELLYGARHSKAVERHLAKVHNFLKPLTIFSFTSMTADYSSQVREMLTGVGKPIGPMDTLIAGHALEHRLTLVTGNVKEFGRIGGLLIETW